MTGDTNDAICLMYGRYVEKFDDLDDALGAAWARDEWSDEDWWDKIEVVSIGGAARSIYHESPEYVAYVAVMNEARREREKVNPPRPFIGNITIDGDVLESLYGDDDPSAKLDELRPYLGDRVAFDPARIKHYR